MTQLHPKAVFDCFAQLNAVPRPSKREEKVQAFLMKFGQDLGLDTQIDAAGNILIKKPATPGMEDCKTVVLQSHADMVCEKNKDVEFDFDNDAIQTYVDGEWLKAKGTTLGADDGIGVAMQMAVLQATDIQHGPIECLFTSDEETGLTGAMGLQAGFLTGNYLINLDSEDEGQLFVSCAGGVRTEATYTIEEEAMPEGYFTAKVFVKGLTGGHSGDDIIKKRANANKLLLRFIYNTMQNTELRLVDIQAGGLHNAIPREATAVVAVPMGYKEQLRIDLNLFAAAARDEFSVTEPSMLIDLESQETPATCLAAAPTVAMIKSLYVVHNGVFAMSQDLENFVETSSNLASIRRQGQQIVATTSQRSSIASNLENMAAMIRATLELGGAVCVTNDGYPGWKMNPHSDILRVAVESYQRLYGREPKVLGIHAGLECGLFSEKYPHLDMVSMGPTMRGVHSPDERLLIPTVQLVWDHLLDMLRNIPKA
ncbi:MAG: aminoacyl-histidine dipeptidase [Bacteroidales bacterium]|nr:aminoacyl-histidine dipeptidase [Bacteroidales bacterium]